MQKITKSDAPTLDDLRELLVEEAYRMHAEYQRGDIDEPRKLTDEYDLTSLPVYGVLNPEDTTGIYSWDDTRVLLDDGDGRWSIVDAE